MADADLTLDAIREAWDKNTGEGRDENATRALADQYVAAHPDQFTELQGLTLAQLVQAVQVFRDAGLPDSQWRVETWLLHHYEPQSIGGPVDARVRVAN